MLQELDKIMFNKDFSKIGLVPLLEGANDVEYSLEQLLRGKAAIYCRLSEVERLSEESRVELEDMIDKLPLPTHLTELAVEKCQLRASLCQFAMTISSEYERQLQASIKELPPLQRLLTLPLYHNIVQLPYLATCLLQLYIRKLCIVSVDSAFIDELSAVLNFHIRIYQVLSRNPEQYVNGGLLMRHLYNIIVHRLISYYNTNLKVQYRDVLASYCSMFGSTYQELLTSKLQMCLLYNILKIVAPMNEQEQVDLTAVFVYLKANPQPQLLKEKVFCLFARLNELIDERSYRLLNSAGEDARAQKSVRTHLWPQLYIFCSLNLNFITLKLEEVVKQIITHRLPSLLSFLGLRYQMNNTTKLFVEKVYDSPFNHEIQTIKLCFELFNSEEFDKLAQLAENVLSSEACKQLRERQILVVMCSIFKGVVMQNFEEGLVFAKLNHFEFGLKDKEGKLQSILSEETLLQHVGFAYYNAAKHSEYLSNKLAYSAKALENFLRSYELNRENYLLSYSLGKLYLQNYDYDSAYKFASAACKNNKDNWQPFALLACVYMCRKKHHKAELIVRELLNRHPHCPTLYYVRAYTEAYKILQDVYTNEEVEASKFLGNDYYESYKERVLRSKDVRHVLHLLQRYFRMLVYEQFDEVAYDEQFLAKVRLQPEMYEDQLLTSNYFKAMENCFDVLFHLDQVALCDFIVKKLASESKRQDFGYRYYKGKVHEKKKELSMAVEEYSQLLLSQPYHPEALISLSLLEKDNEKANQYIQLASKFRDNDDFNYAKGMCLSRIGEFERAHSYFLKEARTCWLDSLPDFMYYY